MGNGFPLLNLHGLQALLLGFYVRGCGKGLDAHPAGGFVHEVHRLVGQKAIRNVAVRQGHRRVQGFIGNAHLMMGLVAVPQSLENLKGFLGGGFAHHHGLEAPLQGRVLFNIFPVFVQGGSTYALELAPGQGGFKNVGGVHAAFRLAGAYQVVDLVNEENDVPRLADLLHGVFQPFLKLAAVFAPGNHAAHIQGQHPLVPQQLRNIPLSNALGQALHHGALAHPGFTNQHGIVLGAPGQNLNNPLDLSIPADYRIQLALAGCLGQIPAILGKGGRLLLSPALFLGPFLLHVAHVPVGLRAQLNQQLLTRLVKVHAQLAQHIGRHAIPLPENRQPEMLHAHIALSQAAGLQNALLQQLLGPRRQLKQGGCPHRAEPVRRAHAKHVPHLLIIHPGANSLRKALRLLEQSQQQVLRTHIRLTQLRCLPLGG